MKFVDEARIEAQGGKPDDDGEQFHTVVRGPAETFRQLFTMRSGHKYDPVASRSGVTAGGSVCVYRDIM